jgi:hypothetical protein
MRKIEIFTISAKIHDGTSHWQGCSISKNINVEWEMSMFLKRPLVGVTGLLASENRI